MNKQQTTKLNFEFLFLFLLLISNVIFGQISILDISAPNQTFLGQFCYKTTAYNSTLSVLKNIKFNALLPATPSNSIIQTLTPMPLGLTLNLPAGTVNVAAGMQPGNYVFQYKVCSLINPTNCSNAIYAVLDIQSTVTASSDVMIVNTAGNPTIAYPTFGAINVLTNDIYGCIPNGIVAALPSITLTETTNPANQYYGINAAGTVYRKPPVSAILPIGNPAVTLTYKICDPLFPLENCSFSTVHIEVRPLGLRGVSTSLKVNNYNTVSNKITIQPNPSSGNFNIRFNNKYNNAIVSVYNLLGEKIIDQSISDQLDYSLDLSNFCSGTFLLKIEMNNEIFTEKIIKQ